LTTSKFILSGSKALITALMGEEGGFIPDALYDWIEKSFAYDG
jgi:hypothetical protein